MQDTNLLINEIDEVGDRTILSARSWYAAGNFFVSVEEVATVSS